MGCNTQGTCFMLLCIVDCLCPTVGSVLPGNRAQAGKTPSKWLIPPWC